MSFVLYGMIGIAIVIALTLLIWLIMVMFQPKDDFKDSVIHLNFSSHFDRSSGTFIGIEEKNQGTGKSGRHYLEVMPKDIAVDAKKEDIKKVKIIVDRNRYLSFPAGTLSANRSISIGLPKHASDLHEAMKNTEFGKAMMIASEIQGAANAEIDSLLEGHDRKDDILNRIGHAELSKASLNMITELYNDALKASIESRGRQSTGSILPQSLGNK